MEAPVELWTGQTVHWASYGAGPSTAGDANSCSNPPAWRLHKSPIAQARHAPSRESKQWPARGLPSDDLHGAIRIRISEPYVFPLDVVVRWAGIKSMRLPFCADQSALYPSLTEARIPGRVYHKIFMGKKRYLITEAPSLGPLAQHANRNSPRRPIQTTPLFPIMSPLYQVSLSLRSPVLRILQLLRRPRSSFWPGCPSNPCPKRIRMMRKHTPGRDT